MKQLILSLIIATSVFGFVDLGVRGQTYDIKEKSFKEEVAEKIKSIDFLMWEKKIADGLDESLKFKSKLGLCQENKNWLYDPTFEIEQDITLPYFNQVLYKKGHRYNPLKENNIQFNKYLFFIDADKDEHLKLAFKYSNVADIFVVKGNFENLKNYNIQGWAFREEIEGKSFKLNCLPTVYTQQNEKFKVTEYKLDYLDEN